MRCSDPNYWLCRLNATGKKARTYRYIENELRLWILSALRAAQSNEVGSPLPIKEICRSTVIFLCSVVSFRVSIYAMGSIPNAFGSIRKSPLLSISRPPHRSAMSDRCRSPLITYSSSISPRGTPQFSLSLSVPTCRQARSKPPSHRSSSYPMKTLFHPHLTL